MKILLVSPPSAFLIDESVFPSLGILYLSAYLKANGYKDIEVLDLGVKDMPAGEIDKDIIGFYSNTPQFPAVIKLVKHFREANRNKRAIYVIGGPHVSGKPEDAVPDFDAVVRGKAKSQCLIS